jgi:hypothetical protein
VERHIVLTRRRHACLTMLGNDPMGGPLAEQSESTREAVAHLHEGREHLLRDHLERTAEIAAG